MVKAFLDSDFLLQTKTAQILYHDYASKMPIIDYHNHLPPDQILHDINFDNLTHAWLAGDHYKWRAMRANGIDEGYCTGEKSDFEKFEKWAETVPFTMRNPLYHWSHLELQRYFGVHELLNEKTAKKIYEECTEKLGSSTHSVRNLLKMMDVKTVCTTDDPLDTLEHHIAYNKELVNKPEGSEVKMLPAFRPDKFILIDNPNFSTYISKLSEIVNFEINDYLSLQKALRKRADFFAEQGGKIADHGLEQIYAEDFTEEQADAILKKTLSGLKITLQEATIFKSAVLHFLGVMYSELNWIQQFHIGALRNNNKRAMRLLGADTG